MEMRLCGECGKPLDGESRFWCREHYVSLGTFKVKVTQEILDRVYPKPDSWAALTEAYKQVRNGA